jgi:hypothetical protein
LKQKENKLIKIENWWPKHEMKDKIVETNNFYYFENDKNILKRKVKEKRKI